MPSAQVIKGSLNGCFYFTCKQCLFTTLRENEMEDHLSGKMIYQNCDRKLELKCFGCTNIFFSKYSLLTHAIYDHQMKELYATILINYLTNEPQDQSQPSEPKTDVNSETKIPPEKSNGLRIINDIRLPASENLHSLCKVITNAPSTNVRLDISGALEEEIIHDLNNPLDGQNHALPSANDKNENSKKKEPNKDDVPSKSLGFKCDIEKCNVRLLAMENIAYHRKCHNPEAKGENDTYWCPECSEFFSHHWNNMASHLWRLHLVDMELHACKLCNYKTPVLSKLIHQHQGIHNNERPFICEFCGKGFKTSKQWRTHKMSHRQNNTTTYACDKCQRVFKASRLLKLHNSSVHSDYKPFSCNFCDFSASTRSSLKLHLRRHTGIKPFSCDQCDYKSADHNAMRRHKLQHLGLKPYKCTLCDYSCIQSSTYKTHVKNKHPGLEHEVIFSCEYCSYRSLNEGKFRTHMAKHKESSSNKS